MTTDIRQMRAANYRIKKDAEFKCERCGKSDQLLAVDIPAENRSGCFCETCITDRRTHRVRPHQWDEAEQIRQEIKEGSRPGAA